MKKKILRRGMAVLGAAAVLTAAVPLQTIQGAAATKDISDTMKWGTLRIGGGGFVSGIVTGKKVMYARTDVGGAYRYNYATESWEQLFDFITDADRGMLSVDAMAIDPTDDNTVYFLCGCAYFSSARTSIYKTTDGGKTFTEYDVTDLIQVFGNGWGRQCGESIAVDPDNPNTIYAGGDVSKNGTGLIKSTDGGKTWKPVEGYSNLEFGGRHYFEYDVTWPFWEKKSVVKAATTDLDGEAGYVQQNGVSNIAITGGKVYVGTSVVGITNMVAANVKDDKFSALSADLPDEYYPSRINVDANGDLLITYMAGLNFQAMAGGAYRYSPKTGKVEQILDGDAGYGSVWADPANPDHLIAGTCGKWQDQEWEEWTEEHGAVWGDQYFRSFDGGKTWQNFTPGKTKGWKQPLISDYLQDGGYAWIREKAIHWSGTVVTDPRNPDRMFITSGNGVFVCDNVWSTDDDKLPTYTFHPDGIEEVVSLDFVSTADGLDLSAIGDYDGFVHEAVDKVPAQYQPNMGSTTAIAVCPQNTDVWARLAKDVSKGYYTTDRGKTWKEFQPAAAAGKLSITELSKGKYRIINSGNEKSGALSYSDDFGATWNKCEGMSCDKTIYTLVDPKNPKIVYASGVKYNEYWSSDTTKKEPTLEECHYAFGISTDYGATFKSITVCRYDMCDSTGDPAYVTTDTIAVAGGWHGLYLITDSGTKAEKLDSVFYAKTVGYGAPEKSGGVNTLYIYGKPLESDPEGIYRSTDAGKTWVCINTDHLYGGTGNGNYLVGDLDEFGKVYMSTVGCGIVYGELDDGTEKPPKTTTEPADTTTVPQEEEILWGDADCSGKVDIADGVLLARYLAEDKEAHITEIGIRNSKVLGNEKLTAGDAAKILEYLANLITKEQLAPPKK